MCADHAMEPTGGVPRILSDLAEGHLTGTETAAVVAWITAAGLENVPPWILNRAVGIAGQTGAREPSRPVLWRRLVGPLVYDTRLQLRAAGARSAVRDHPRVRYEADFVEIDLEVGQSARAHQVRLLGHVTAAERDLVGAWVTIDGPSGHRGGTVDELGQFSLDGLVPGVHRMEIGLATELIEISELRL